MVIMSNTTSWWKEKADRFFRWFGRFLKNLFTGKWMGDTDLSRISSIIFWSIVIACIASVRNYETLIWSFAALMCGMLLGFLFGIPRVQQSPSDPANGEPASNNGYKQRVNTNLEEISDWLTKIIIGVGLVELSQIPRNFETLVNYITTEGHDPGTIGTILVLFAILGFFTGYLLTRVYLAAAFSRADQLAESFSRGVQEAKEDLDESLPEPMEFVPYRAKLEKYEELASVSPRTAVVEAWIDLVSVGREVLQQRGIEPEFMDQRLIQQLAKVKIVSAGEIGIYHELRQLRNTAAHSEEHGITTKAAMDYAALATRLANKLKQSSQSDIEPPVEE